jgi:predicted TIM-barrel fold metal-dependent hydrolase
MPPKQWPPVEGVIDTMIGFPTDPEQLYAGLRPSLRDRDSLEELRMPAGYMFHDVPVHSDTELVDPIDVTLAEMDRFGVSTGLVSLSVNPEVTEAALTRHPGRFVPSFTVDPNQGMKGVEQLVRAYVRWGVRAASFFPHGTSPQVAIDAPLAYVYYAKCVELGIPIFVTVGIAGPRVPSLVQHVERLDQVLYDFPDLVLVMRHGTEPWTDLAVKLMLKWPNLYYSTSGFAPKYYPASIVDYANTRGASKILYAGYFPMGLTLERIFTELASVPFNDEVWPEFLGANAARVLKLERLP